MEDVTNRGVDFGDYYVIVENDGYEVLLSFHGLGYLGNRLVFRGFSSDLRNLIGKLKEALDET